VRSCSAERAQIKVCESASIVLVIAARNGIVEAAAANVQQSLPATVSQIGQLVSAAHFAELIAQVLRQNFFCCCARRNKN